MSSSIVLAPLGALYGAVMQMRATCYRTGLLKTSKLNEPVISVGNITTGGTGKTPLVEWVARALAHEGRRVCILTRGYGRANSGSRVVVSDGQAIMANEGEAGDEPLLLARSLLGQAAVICDADRFSAGEWATVALGSDVFVLDDGFQHLRLSRELNIVTIDATNPWGHGHVLPHGRLREPRSELSRADCVVITRADQTDTLDSLHEVVAQLSVHRPIFTSRMKVRALRRLEDQPKSDVMDQSIERPTAAFCAIGNPRAFLSQLKNAGHDVTVAQEFSDHHQYSQSDIDAVVEKARHAGAKSLITTAKDAVKLRSLNFELPCHVLEIDIVIDDETGILQMIRSAIGK